MGEYAVRLADGERVKIGTCENMMYLRADQVDQVRVEGFDVTRATDVRFRFPWPNEDTVLPGDFRDGDWSLPVQGGMAPPKGVDHYTVQFKAHPGYLLSLPCPESGPTGLPIHRNGFGGGLRLVQQRAWEGRLVIVAECGGCGCRWRYPTLEDAEELLTKLDEMATHERNEFNVYGSKHRGDYYAEIARRARAGYTNPPAWVVNMHRKEG